MQNAKCKPSKHASDHPCISGIVGAASGFVKTREVDERSAVVFFGTAGHERSVPVHIRMGVRMPRLYYVSGGAIG